MAQTSTQWARHLSKQVHASRGSVGSDLQPIVQPSPAFFCSQPPDYAHLAPNVNPHFPN